jgi:hypothetical protein
MVRPGETGTCVLGIESSCDDTGAAVVTADGRVLGESLASQGAIHAPWGGVVPKLAQGAHEEAIDRVVQEALDAAGVAPSDLDAIAVTVGPGLSLCLRVSTYATASRRSPRATATGSISSAVSAETHTPHTHAGAETHAESHRSNPNPRSPSMHP